MSSDDTPARVQRGARFERWMRVERERDFRRAYRSGGRARGRFLTIVAVPNGLGWTRLGLSIGKRYAKGAVERNRMRRIVREAFRLSYRELPGGLDLIAIGSEPAVDPPLAALRTELVAVARRAGERARSPRPKERAR